MESNYNKIVCILNLSDNTIENDIKEMFKAVGAIENIEYINGHTFITFETEDQVEASLFYDN